MKGHHRKQGTAQLHRASAKEHECINHTSKRNHQKNRDARVTNTVKPIEQNEIRLPGGYGGPVKPWKTKCRSAARGLFRSVGGGRDEILRWAGGAPQSRATNDGLGARCCCPRHGRCSLVSLLLLREKGREGGGVGLASWRL